MLPLVSIVIPAYQEARRLPATLAELARWAGEEAPGPVEVLIVVEHSRDGTLALAESAAAEHGHLWRAIDNGPQRGKGHAVRAGMLQATGDFIFYMDADLSVPLREVGAFLQRFREHPDLALLAGSRQHAQSRITRPQRWLRRSMGQTFNRILAALTLAGIADTQCGFKAFRRAAAHEIFRHQQLDGFAFDVEVLLLARKLGLPLGTMPVEWMNSPESHVHIARDSLRMLRDALRVRWMVARRLRGTRP